MATQRITFTEWTPDQPSIVENLSIAKNVVPAAVGFTPFPTAVDYSAAASENLNNIFAGRFSSTTNVFAGGATRLFRLDGSDLSMDNVSKTDDYAAVERWRFIQFGDTVIAANNINKLQSFTLGSSTAFADLAADAPIAKFVTVVRDFVVTAHLDGGSNPNKVQWSDINDETDWVAGGASQSDFQIVVDGGNITGITGGETGLILLERAIVRMSYIGSPFFFQFDTISRSLGCTQPNSIAKYGNMTYFLGEEGFYACDGNSVTPIGNEKIDRWFYANANPSALDTMSTSIDPFRKIVVWNFLDTFGSRNLLIYNWQVNKWTYGTTDTNYVSSSATAGTTLEGMNLFGTVNAGSFVIGERYTIQTIGTTNFTLYGAASNTIGLNFKATGVGAGTGTVTSIDVITTSFDSSLFSGGKFLFAGARGTKIVTFTGQPASAQIDTGLVGSEAPSVITLARPLVDAGSADVAIASQVKLDQVIDFGTYIPADSENRVPLRSAGKYHKLSVKPTGARWSNIIGIDVDIIGQGTR